MSVFSSAWVDGKISNIDKLLSENSDRKFMFILDTNFAIMSRYYITEREQFNKYYANQINDFLNVINVIKNKASRIVYTLACEEASRSKLTGNIDVEKYKLMVECVGKVFDIDFRSDLISKNELIEEDVSISKTPILLRNGLFKEHTVITYTTLLKAFLFKQFDSRASKIKIKEMFHYLADEINVFSPTSMSFVIHYLGNEPSILKGVKPNLGIKEILNKLYAASIDMIMPTQASQLAELTDYQEVPLFITFDKGIKLLFDSLLIIDEHYLGEGTKVPKYSTMIFYSSGWKDKDIHELYGYAEQVQKANRKKVIDKDFELRRLNKLAGRLEQELLLKIETLNEKE
ncbi:hypothetical protein GC096_02235 [Paenibacillus sp. LMG 31461]|uniref:DUF4935 domain-containing protein n=1 Tax=Paenibacillus plantarum TaxID=2654975 RepID=A0ABX1X409_9BACL|nr:hypothetical protein [Paenibacillus plantarum]NOU62866.1 hypothetical protein [Paenibacillus plantarum]